MDAQANNNGVVRLAHSGSCQTSAGDDIWDVTCPKCKVIKKVIFLKRHSVALGATEDEEKVNFAAADAIIDKYRLKRGDVFDRLYPPPTKEEFAAPETSHGHKIVSSGGNAAAYGYRSRARKDMSW